MEVEKIELRFDDLLERHYNNATRLELDQVYFFFLLFFFCLLFVVVFDVAIL